MTRRDRNLPEGWAKPAGEMIERNPGVALLWTSRTYRAFTAPHPDGTAGVLFDIGDPSGVEWYAHGRRATRDEVMASIDSGMPILREEADGKGDDAEAANAALTVNYHRAMLLVPPHLPPDPEFAETLDDTTIAHAVAERALS